MRLHVKNLSKLTPPIHPHRRSHFLLHKQCKKNWFWRWNTRSNSRTITPRTWRNPSENLQSFQEPNHRNYIYETLPNVVVGALFPAYPWGPVAPSFPIAPVALVAPSIPVGPVAPVGPLAPRISRDATFGGAVGLASTNEMIATERTSRFQG